VHLWCVPFGNENAVALYCFNATDQVKLAGRTWQHLLHQAVFAFATCCASLPDGESTCGRATCPAKASPLLDKKQPSRVLAALAPPPQGTALHSSQSKAPAAQVPVPRLVPRGRALPQAPAFLLTQSHSPSEVPCNAFPAHLPQDSPRPAASNPNPPEVSHPPPSSTLLSLYLSRAHLRFWQTVSSCCHSPNQQGALPSRLHSWAGQGKGLGGGGDRQQVAGGRAHPSTDPFKRHGRH